MSINWIDMESGALLIKRQAFVYSDGIQHPEDTILGGIISNNKLSMGWANYKGEKKEMQIRNHPKRSKMDVEKYLMFRGMIDEPITTISALNLTANEKVG